MLWPMRVPSTSMLDPLLPLGMSIARVSYETTDRDANSVIFSSTSRPLTEAQVLRDPVARAAAANFGQLATWASVRGYGFVEDVLRGAEITLHAGMTPDGAYADLAFHEPRRLTRLHMVRSPEVVAHEVAHRVTNAFNVRATDGSNLLSEVEEGIADVFGVAYARSVGYGPADP